MSDIIHLLPDSVANQIAAGEVIQRPASVLKELVENSIDAGATHIQVIIKDAGRTLLQVTDNGKGMSETDARMAFERHATSKIKDANDLFSLRTMGFRGEALASIAAVAQVEMKTRRTGDELGVAIEIAGTRVFKHEPVSCSEGTSILVKNLFFNVPARRRFLKSDNVEKSHILNEFYRIVLVYPDIVFSFFDGDEELLHLPQANIKQRIEHVFGKSSKRNWQQQLLSVETSTNLVKIHGYAGKPEFAQKAANQYFFVNGRYMRHPYFHKAVMMAYHQLIPPTEGPHYFIYFEVNPDTIDINIHPTKTEIKFENEQAIWSILSAAVKESLGKFNVAPSIDFDTEGMPDIPVHRNDDNIRPPRTTFNPEYNPFSSSSYKRTDINWESLYKGFEKQEDAPASLSGEITVFDETEEDKHPALFDENEIKNRNYQFKNQYIISGIKSGLMMIDQHRAHVKIMYETYRRQIEKRQGASQQLLFPETLELNVADRLLFDRISVELRYTGFDFSEDNGWITIGGIPSGYNSSDAVSFISRVLSKIRELDAETSGDTTDVIAAELAESAAIRNGQPLTDVEMNDLIDRLFACEDYHYTPDGKKIFIVLETTEIEKRFIHGASDF